MKTFLKYLMGTAFLILQPFISTSQQDPKTTLYMFSLLNINPAFAGSKSQLITSLQVRNQWSGIPGAPKTNIFSLNIPTKYRKTGWALQVSKDEIGPKQISGAEATYAYHLGKSNRRLSMGLRLGIFNYAYNWSSIEYRDNEDIYKSSGQTSKIAFSSDAGMYYYTSTWYSGLSFTHLNQDKISEANFSEKELARMSIHSYFVFGKGFIIHKNLLLNPSVLVRHSPASTSMDFNCNLLILDRIWVGASVRTLYGYALLTQVLLSDKLKFGYSFDAGQNKIGKAGGISHEFLLQYDFNIFRSKIISPRFM